MDEQMIADIAKAIRLGRFERNGKGGAYDPDLPLHETEIADATAAHSVMAGKVAELVEALERIANARTAMDGGSIAECRRTAAAALAPYPERRSE